MYIRKKTFVLIVTYLTAAVAALGAMNALACTGSYRRSVEYGYRHAFDEVVSACEKLTDALHRGSYCTGPELSASVCADVYGSCLAAGYTLGALPFSTQELEKTSGFVGTAGDYAASLLRTAVEKGFTDTERKSFAALYKSSVGITKSLRGLQDDVISGEVRLDEPENLFSDTSGSGLLSTAMLKLEDGFPELPELCYDGEYTVQPPEPTDDPVTVEAARKAAEDFLGAKGLTELFRSEAGVTAFEDDGRTIIVDGSGNVVSVSSSRAVSGGISDEKLRAAAEKFLDDKGFSELSLSSAERTGDVLFMCFDCAGGGVRRESDCVRIAFAGDDGELYSFDASKHINAPEITDTAPRLSESEARSALPEGLEAKSAGLVFSAAPGGKERLCYAFDCTDGNEKLCITVDANTGRQFGISFD